MIATVRHSQQIEGLGDVGGRLQDDVDIDLRLGAEPRNRGASDMMGFEWDASERVADLVPQPLEEGRPMRIIGNNSDGPRFDCC